MMARYMSGEMLSIHANKKEPIMRRYYFLVMTLLVCIITSAFFTALSPVPLHAADLPIDIDAIRRQPTTDIQLPGQFRTNLFTDDSRILTDAVEEQNRLRQESASELFSEARALYYPVDSRDRLAQTVESMALFSTPTDFSHVSMPSQEDEIPTWLIVIIIAAASFVGFLLAMIVRSKKKSGEGDVH